MNEKVASSASQGKELDSIVAKLQAMDIETRNWTLKLIDFIVDYPK